MLAMARATARMAAWIWIVCENAELLRCQHLSYHQKKILPLFQDNLRSGPSRGPVCRLPPRRRMYTVWSAKPPGPAPVLARPGSGVTRGRGAAHTSDDKVCELKSTGSGRWQTRIGRMERVTGLRTPCGQELLAVVFCGWYTEPGYDGDTSTRGPENP